MTTIEYITTVVFPAAFALLPAKMDSPEARAMLVAIGYQESRFEHRRQVSGPARGFWQFEHGGGVRGVLTHTASKQYIQDVLSIMEYNFSPDTSYAAIEHHDILAVCYARLLLWTLPDPLPKQGEYDESWDQYMAAWRAGRPHRATWNAFYDRAWT
jgi:hypothetical protein